MTVLDSEARLEALAREGARRGAERLHYERNADDAPPITATPFILPDPASLPRRAYLMAGTILRGELTTVLAPGGVGKTTITLGFGLSLATGLDLFNRRLPEGAVRVWIWNLEDDRIELARLLSAACILHGITAADIDDRLFVDGLDQSLCMAAETSGGARVVAPVMEAVSREIKRRKIDVLIIDPFVSSHSISENDNGAIDAVAKAWKRLAQDTGCAVVLVHHTRKTGGNEVTVEDARGASALTSAARVALTLNPMREDEGNRFGITDPAERRTLIRVDAGKTNRAPPEAAQWIKLHSIDLGNGDGLHVGDKVGAAGNWTAPDPFDGIVTRDLYNVQMAIAGGEYGQSAQATDWAGYAVAEVLGLDAGDEAVKVRIKALLKTWTATGSLVVETRRTTKGRDKPCLVVGKWVDPATLPTPKSGVGTSGVSGETQAPEPTPPPPLYMGVGGGVGEEPPAPSSGELSEPETVEACAVCGGVGCEYCR